MDLYKPSRFLHFKAKKPEKISGFLFYSRFYPCAGDIFLKAPEKYDIITNEGK